MDRTTLVELLPGWRERRVHQHSGRKDQGQSVSDHWGNIAASQQSSGRTAGTTDQLDLPDHPWSMIWVVRIIPTRLPLIDQIAVDQSQSQILLHFVMLINIIWSTNKTSFGSTKKHSSQQYKKYHFYQTYPSLTTLWPLWLQTAADLLAKEVHSDFGFVNKTSLELLDRVPDDSFSVENLGIWIDPIGNWFLKNWPFPASFSLLSAFQCSRQYIG